MSDDAPRAGGETVKSLFAFASRAYVLLDNVTDDDECVRDHHGNCQTHLGEAGDYLAIADDDSDEQPHRWIISRADFEKSYEALDP